MNPPLTRTRGLAAAALLAAAPLLAGCSLLSENQRTSVTNVVTLQTGTAADLKAMRGRGPFVSYAVAPGAMLDVLARAMENAAGPAGKPPWVTVYVSKRYGEVLAKEFPDSHDSYGDPFRSACLAIVHPVEGTPDACRVETHVIQRGPFHRGRVAWRPQLDGWIADALADREGVRPLR